MIGSLRKGDELNSRLKEYGMIILDECHHAATKTATDVLQFANAKYVLGVTATPNRGDKLNKTNLMLLGPIRYKYTAKQRAQEQGIDHLVYPRFTRTVAPRFNREKMEVNDAYELLRNNDERDNLIISDIKDCINQGRTPIVLSRYVDHSRKLYDKLQGCADHIFILYGKNTKKENRSIIGQMNNVKADESMILIATGSLVGEGFDYPRLDTLFMTTPVSGSNVVEQYTGRLNRDYEGKRNVIVYDYVDGHIPIFENMYNKRLKAYKKIGYDICTFNETKEYVSVVNSIYDFESYKEVYDNDLENACKEIIISSPVISSYKIESLIQQLSKQQQNGVRVIIITWKPDSYGFGDSTCWIRLHERMRLSGFEVNVVEDYCEHYCIIDRKIVWYGSMNFLGKEDIDDNLMRIIDEKIALELLRLTFTNDKYLGELL